MELLYYYIFDDKRNIKNCEFNFSPNYNFSFDPATNHLTKTEVVRLPSYWFGSNINNITAIIGKNGTGKSNLIESLIETLCYQGGGLLIWKKNNTLYRNKTAFNVNCNFDLVEWPFWGSPFNTDINGAIQDTVVIYYSPTIDRDVCDRKKYYSKFRNISIAHSLRQKCENKVKTPEYTRLPEVEYMQLIDTFRLMLFFIYAQENGIELPFDLRKPEYLSIIFHLYDDKNPDHPIYLALNENRNGSFESELKYVITRQIFSNKDNISDDWNINTSFQNILSVYCHKSNSDRPNIYDEMVQLYAEGKVSCNLNAQRSLNIGGELCVKIRTDALTTKFLTALFGFYFRQEPYFASFSSLSSLKNIENDLISIKWDGMSSGEYAFYNFISRLYGELCNMEHEVYVAKEYRIKRYNSYFKTVIIILDEVELSFHPKWQQKFMNLLTSSLLQIFHYNEFQIILTSHSPILISDIPKSNIIFLNKNSNGKCQVYSPMYQKETFGANIHTLFNDSFFLEGLPIGDFAKNKIQNLFDRLDNRKEHTSQILSEINIVGEPILKNQLMKIFKRNLTLTSIDDQIKFYEQEIELLKLQKNDTD